MPRCVICPLYVCVRVCVCVHVLSREWGDSITWLFRCTRVGVYLCATLHAFTSLCTCMCMYIKRWEAVPTPSPVWNCSHLNLLLTGFESLSLLYYPHFCSVSFNVFFYPLQKIKTTTKRWGEVGGKHGVPTSFYLLCFYSVGLIWHHFCYIHTRSRWPAPVPLVPSKLHQVFPSLAKEHIRTCPLVLTRITLDP